MSKSIWLLVAGAVAAVLIAPAAASGIQARQTQAPAAPAANPVPAANPALQSTAPAAAAEAQAAPAANNAAPALPKMADAMKNPVKPTAESRARAKQLYSIDCSMCHGDNGNGKTDLATSMALTLTDFTDAKTLAARGDGELFNLIRDGKDKMPGEDPARAKDADVWNLIIYVRSLSKTGASAAPAAATASK